VNVTFTFQANIVSALEYRAFINLYTAIQMFEDVPIAIESVRFSNITTKARQ